MRTLGWILIAFCLALPASASQDDLAPGAHRYFTDVELINQDGETMRLYSDLLQGKVVVIDTMFTTCKSVCPVMHRTFTELQTWLGDRLGKDVYLISVTVDPENDTPEKLREYADKLKAKDGWYFVTGDKENLEFALRKLGQFVEDKDDHSTVFLIGNEPTGLWKKAMGMSHPKEIAKIVESVLDDQGTASDKAGSDVKGGR